ncbi:MAG: LpqB family beta-propeller domain-containing protein [Nocardioides sp.]
MGQNLTGAELTGPKVREYLKAGRKVARTRGVLAGLATVLATGVLCSGCLRMPDAGPVVTTSQGGRGDVEVGPYIDPAPPRPGESPSDIVKHFLDAMMASSLQVNVAREFLSEGIQASWNPKRATLTYDDAGQPQGTSSVLVPVTGVNRLDAGGAWLGPAGATSLKFPMIVEKGEWRIAEAPDALIVPQRWFEQRFQQAALYFFDPTAKVLVPEPVYLPRGEQLASSLVRGLLTGPRPGNAQVSRTFLPSEAKLELSVPVSEDGLAEIALQGDPGDLAREAAPLVLAQFAWTLRQDPDVRSFRLTIGDEPVGLPAGVTELSVDYGADYDPAVLSANSDLFGLRRGLVVSTDPDTDADLQGPLSATKFEMRDFAVDLSASRVAAVSAGGREVVVAELTQATDPPRQVMAQGENILKPVWDLGNRLWLVDRRQTGSIVSVVVDESRSEVTVPGVTGADVKAFLVSRDGSRFVAVVAKQSSDQVLVGRVVRDNDGTVQRVTTPRVIVQAAPNSPVRVSAVGWRSPTLLAMAVRATEDRDELRFVSIDGGPNGPESLSETRRMLSERVRRLTASPLRGANLYVTTKSGVQDPVGADRPYPLDSSSADSDAADSGALDPAIELLTYTG